MASHNFLRVVLWGALGAVSFAPAVFARDSWLAVTQGPAKDGSPAWHAEGSFPDPTGHTLVAPGGHVTVTNAHQPERQNPLASPCSAAIAKYCSDEAGMGQYYCLEAVQNRAPQECRAALGGMHERMLKMNDGAPPPCSHSALCDNQMTNGVGPRGRGQLQRVLWDQHMGYAFSYPYDVPQGFGGIPSVALDSKGDLWVFKRAPKGTPQLYEFGPDRKLIRTVGDNVIGHAIKAHGMAIDSHDNVWLCDEALAIVEEVSPEGKLIRVIGTRGHRGDWDEARGQRLLWEPVMVAFGPKGDIYIAEGHGNESPNDTDSGDPANQSGASRIIHLDRNARFVNQWYGNNVGPGKFTMAHGLAVDPKTGDVWVGDREQYRIVVFTADGKYVKTLQERNLVCALNFDPEGNPWMASGQDGQFLKLDRDGKVLGAIGNGMGIGPGQFIEASYWSFDKHDNLYAGDTSVGRVTVMLAPKH